MAKKAALKPPSAEESKIVRANVNRKVEKSPTFVSLYSNDTQVQVSPWDVRLIFGVIAEAATVEQPTVTVETLGEVRMSPQHAKVVAAILIGQLKIYEESLGKIPIPLPEASG